MEPRRVGMAGALFGLALAMSTAGFGQSSPALKPPPPDASTFLNQLVTQVSGQQVIRQLEDRMEKECAAVAISSPVQLSREERWLKGLVDEAEDRLERAKDHLANTSTVDMGPSAHEAAVDGVVDAVFELRVTALIAYVVGDCIEKRKREQQGQRWMQGRWTVGCNKVPGVTPDTGGEIEVQLLPDNSVAGKVYPTDSKVGVEVSGTLQANGRFHLVRPGKGHSITVEVQGGIDTSNPLSASGTLSIVSALTNYGTSVCRGTWQGAEPDSVDIPDTEVGLWERRKNEPVE